MPKFHEMPDDYQVTLTKSDFQDLIKSCQSTASTRFQKGIDNVESGIGYEMKEFFESFDESRTEVEEIARRLACRGASDSEILDAILDAIGPGVRTAVRALQGG